MSAPSRWLRMRRSLLEHAGVLAGYALLAAGITWPLARDFTTRVIGVVAYDVRHTIWLLWYLKEVVSGRASWPYTMLLHYPYGITTLVDGVGPVNGVLALPFWPLGPAAAYNGAVLVGIALSGWFMYLLARHLSLDRASAGFAGVLFIVWPMHLVAVYGHLEKLFTGLLPLTLLAGLIAFDLRRRPVWSAAVAAVLLETLLQNGNQFLFAVVGIAVVALVQLAGASRADRRRLFGRIALTAGVSVAVCSPLLVAIVRAAGHRWMIVSLGDRSGYYAPDLLHLLVPSIHQALGGSWFYPDPTFLFDFTRFPILTSLAPRPGWYGSGMETAVTVPLSAVALAIAAWRLDGSRARTWLWVAFVCTLLALGPFLRVAGRTEFTSLGWRLPLPQALLARLPGFDVMRTPGRFMMIGSVGWTVAAAVGLAAVARRRGWRTDLLASVAGLVVLVECWPAVWPQQVLPPVPGFYRNIATDGERYAVLDLPAGWLGRHEYGSAYAFYQVIHRKPIAWSYLSRQYFRYPIGGLNALWDPRFIDYRQTRRRLVGLGYRYVVWHKHGDEVFRGTVVEGQDGTPRQPPGLPDSHPFLREAFRGESPLYEDALVVVYGL
jgi:hypothetical protein